MSHFYYFIKQGDTFDLGEKIHDIQWYSLDPCYLWSSVGHLSSFFSFILATDIFRFKKCIFKLRMHINYYKLPLLDFFKAWSDRTLSLSLGGMGKYMDRWCHTWVVQVHVCECVDARKGCWCKFVEILIFFHGMLAKGLWIWLMFSNSSLLISDFAYYFSILSCINPALIFTLLDSCFLSSS